MQTIKIGLLGLGTVGGGVVKVLEKNRAEIERQAGACPVITHIACRSPSRADNLPVGNARLIEDPMSVVDADVDIVIELMGGEEPALSCIKRAIERKHPVVTANKAVVARYGNEILTLANQYNVSVMYEAAVGGGIPIMRVLSESLVANRIDRVAGIVNGTCNYVLTEIRTRSIENSAAVRQAQALGYAEADPRADIEGNDAGYKLALLAAAAFGTPLMYDRIHIEGITHICPADVQYAESRGYRIRHLAVAQQRREGLELRVHPALIPRHHLLASVDGVENAIEVRGNAVGSTLYCGAGAGAEPTASAVLADAVAIIRAMTKGAAKATYPAPAITPQSLHNGNIPAVIPMDDINTSFYVRLTLRAASDARNVSGLLRRTLDKHKIESGQPVEEIGPDGSRVVLAMMTRPVVEKHLRKALQVIAGNEAVSEMLRIPAEDMP